MLFDYNNIASSTCAYINEAAVSAAGVAVEADDAATITATDGSMVTTGAGGFGAGGVVATNHVVGSASAYVAASDVTANADDVALTAQNNSTITATETTALTADGDAVTLEAAFNVIGWKDDNFGSLALSALIGTDSLLGTATPDQTEAYIDSASNVTAADDVTLSATGQATITATVGDQAAAGNGDATSTVNVGGVLATNKIDTATQAYIGTAPALLASAGGLDTSSVTATAGAVGLSATDSPTLNATSTITLSSTASTGGVAKALSGDYLYTDKSGTETVHKGDQVYTYDAATKTGTVYQLCRRRQHHERRRQRQSGYCRLRHVRRLEGRRRRIGAGRQFRRRGQGGGRGVCAQRCARLCRRHHRRRAGDERRRRHHRRRRDQCRRQRSGRDHGRHREQSHLDRRRQRRGDDDRQ